jgi:hypothetical protein
MATRTSGTTWRVPYGLDRLQVNQPKYSQDHFDKLSLQRDRSTDIPVEIARLCDQEPAVRPIVENILRHSRLPENRDRPIREIAVEAVDEVGNPT